MLAFRSICKHFRMGSALRYRRRSQRRVLSDRQPGTVAQCFIPAMMNVRAINSPGWSWFRIWVHPGLLPDRQRIRRRGTAVARYGRTALRLLGRHASWWTAFPPTAGACRSLYQGRWRCGAGGRRRVPRPCPKCCLNPPERVYPRRIAGEDWRRSVLNSSCSPPAPRSEEERRIVRASGRRQLFKASGPLLTY